MIAFQLHESRTHQLRRYELTPVCGVPAADAVLSIRLGEVGPRGGTSKMRWESYTVQEPDADPEHPQRMGRTFWVARDSRRPVNIDAIPEIPDEFLYEIHIPPRPTVGYCTCTGYRTNGACKHLDCFEHMVHVVGMGRGFVLDASTEEKRVKCCGLEACDLCNGTGWVEVASFGEWGYWS